jgi:hypothetical protein
MIISLIIGIAVLCLAWWAVGKFAPPDLIKPLQIVVFVVFLIWLVRLLGLV